VLFTIYFSVASLLAGNFSKEIERCFSLSNYNDSIEAIEYIEADVDSFKKDLVFHFEEGLQPITTKFNAQAHDYFHKNIGYIDSIRSGKHREVFSNFFEQVKNSSKYINSLNDMVAGRSKDLMKRHITKFHRKIRRQIKDSFNAYDDKMVNDMLDELERNTWKIRVNDFDFKVDDKNLSIKNFGGTIFSAAVVAGIRFAGSNVFKSFIARIFGKAAARSAATPGEWLGPWGWVAEGIVVAGGVAWDVSGNRSKVADMLTKASTNVYAKNVHQPLLNENSDFNYTLGEMYIKMSGLIKTRTVQYITNKWSARLMHTRSADWDTWKKGYPDKMMRIKTLDVVVKVFGKEFAQEKMQTKYLYANMFATEKARRYFKEFGHDFPSLAIAYEKEVRKILDGFNESSKLIRLLVQEHQKGKNTNLFKAVDFLEEFPNPGKELIAFFIFLTERKMDFDYTLISYPRAKFYGKNIGSIKKLWNQEPEMVRDYFLSQKNISSDSAMLFADKVTQGIDLSMLIAMVSQAGPEKALSILKDNKPEDLKQFFKDYGVNPGVKMIAMAPKGLVKTYSMKDIDKNDVVQIYKNLPDAELSSSLTETIVWVLKYTDWPVADVKLTTLGKLSVLSDWYVLHIPFVGLMLGNLVLMTDSFFLSSAIILFVLIILTLIIRFILSGRQQIVVKTNTEPEYRENEVIVVDSEKRGRIQKAENTGLKKNDSNDDEKKGEDS
jgi:hypothetical protein